MSVNRTISDWRGRRVWLIGASSGIGAALAEALSARGAWLALSARRRDALEAVAEKCEDAHVLPLDVTDTAAFKDTHEALLARWDGIDLVIFLAGTYAPTRAWEMTDEAIRGTIDVNLVATMQGVRQLLPDMLQRKQGAVALVASVAGYAGLPQACLYGPTKAALINFAETLHLDLQPRGVDVFLVNPGFVDTPLTRNNDFKMPALLTPAEAAEAMLRGFSRGVFEIHFPKRFSRLLKALRLLPYALYFRLVRRATGL